jgi:hypothetical protein
MNFCTLAVDYCSSLQHKLVFLLPHGAYPDNFSVGVIRRDKMTWLGANVTALCCETAQFKAIIPNVIRFEQNT